MTVALVGIGGIVVGAVLSSLFGHWAWLRGRQLDEYAALVTAFLANASATAAAVQGNDVYDVTKPDERSALSRLVQEAWHAGDAYFAARNRVKLVGTGEANTAADNLSAFVAKTRDMQPVSGQPTAAKVTLSDFPTISSEAHNLVEAFVKVAREDIGNMRTRSLLWRWLRELVT
jgi:hypothetical protein